MLAYNRTLRALHNSSQALIRATDEASYLQEVCRIVVEDCGHALVWIGFAENDADKTIRPVAYSGFEAGYLETLRLTWADTERGRGPKGTAIRTGQIAICRNMLADPSYAPWRSEATRRGYASSIALPLTSNGTTFGALSLYCREPDPFSEDEVKLLSELAGDLAFGISSLRMRVANVAALEALRKSEEQFRTLFESACDGIFIADTQGLYCDANTCGLAMLGLTRDELMGRYVGDIGVEQEQSRVPAAVAEVRSGRPHIAEWQFRRKDGSIFSGELNGQLLPDGRMIGFLRDLTDRKRIQRERDLTIDFLRAVNASNNTGGLMRMAVQFFKEHTGCDAVGVRVREGNDFPYRETLGFSKEFLRAETTLCECGKMGGAPLPACLCGKVITGRFAPVVSSFTEHGAFWTNDTSAVLRVPFEEQDLIRGRCITEGYGSIALIPLHEGDERMGLLQLNYWKKDAFSPETISFAERLANHLSVAVSKFRAEEALARVHDNLVLAQQSAGAGIWDWDLRTGKLDWSPELFRLFGLDPSTTEASYETWQTVVHPSDLTQAAERIDSAVRNRSRLENEYRIVLPTGETRWINALGDVVVEADGRALRISGICLDVTDRKQAEETLRSQTEHLRRANEELASFNRVAVGRELRMIELKKEVNSLRAQAGLDARYPLEMENEKGKGKSQ